VAELLSGFWAGSRIEMAEKLSDEPSLSVGRTTRTVPAESEPDGRTAVTLVDVGVPTETAATVEVSHSLGPTSESPSWSPPWAPGSPSTDGGHGGVSSPMTTTALKPACARIGGMRLPVRSRAQARATPNTRTWRVATRG